jgi:CheY-like chemotaxis protein
LVLSDVVMPKMGGIALLHALRERELSLPMVLLTGHPLEEEIEGLRDEGLNDWLFKPPSLVELAEVVSQALGQ